MINVVPVNDEADHIEDTYCWCEPRVDYRDPDSGEEYTNGPMIIHNAADCREVVEELLGDSLSPDKKWMTVLTTR